MRQNLERNRAAVVRGVAKANLASESGDEEHDVSSSSGSESESNELAERERKLERMLADLPFQELHNADASLATRGASATAAQKKARRECRPMEISTNVWLLRLREVIQVPQKPSSASDQTDGDGSGVVQMEALDGVARLRGWVQEQLCVCACVSIVS